MISTERVLSTLRTQLQFELAQTGAAVAQAATLGAQAQHKVANSTRRREGIVLELRRAMTQVPFNPALLDAMRRLHQEERRVLREAKTGLAAAEQRERQARAALADLRSRDRSLERALQAERHKQQMQQATLENIHADDQWLRQVKKETA